MLSLKTIAELENSLSCRTCKTSLSSIEYRFCDNSYCQSIYIQFHERRRISMRHNFQFDIVTKSCKICNHDIMSHTAMARCSKCAKQTECDLMDGKLLCILCESNYLLEKKTLAEQNETPAPVITQANETHSSLVTLTPQDLLNKARQIDKSVNYPQDFFNLETISLSDIRKAIYENNLIPDEMKELEYSNAIANRIFAFQDKLIKNNAENFELYQKIAADKVELRSFGNAIRLEVQERLKSQDSLYEIAPPKSVKPKVARVKKEKKDPREMVIEAIMASQNCTREKALRIMVDKNLYKAN